MPARKQPSRQAPTQTTTTTQPQTTYKSDALSEFRNRRIQRRLEELERTNPTDIPASSFVPSSTTAVTGVTSSPLPGSTGLVKKKQTANVRKILLTKKSLKDWLDELPSSPTPPYLLAPSLPPSTPPRQLCSSCGYIGAYKCPRCGEFSCDRVCLETHERDGGCGVGG